MIRLGSHVLPTKRGKAITFGGGMFGWPLERIAEVIAIGDTSFFSDIVFNLQSVELPGVQSAIDDAQKAYAQVSKAAAQRETAHQQRLANEEKQKGYSTCSSCAIQDELHALPDKVTTLVLGGSSPVAIGGNR